MKRVPKEYTIEKENPQHLPTSIIQKTAGVDIPLFSVLRNPYDRNCSEYYFIRNHGQTFYTDKDITNKKNLDVLKAISGRLSAFKPIFDRVYTIFYYDMSIEDYLEWCVDNPTYPVYFDTDKTPKDFEVIGITEHMDTTVDLLKAMYNIDAGKGPANENQRKPVGQKYSINYSRSDYERKCSVDYEMYYEGLKKFHDLCDEYLK